MENNSSLFKNLSWNIGNIIRNYTPLLILLAAILIFSIIAPNFTTFNNIRLLVRQISFVTISAVGLMFVMVAGGIDLSIGSQIILTNIVLSLMISSTYGYAIDPLIAVPVCILVGTILGTINGILSNVLKVHPLIITLGTSYIYKGLGYIIA